MQLLGGLGVAKNIYAGGTVVATGDGTFNSISVGTLNTSVNTLNSYFTLTTQSTATNSGAMQLLGGLGVAKNIYAGGTVVATGDGTFNSISVGTLNTSVNTLNSYFTLTTQSTATNSGAMQLLGGLGVAKNIYAGGTVVATGDGTFNSISVGTLNTTVSGHTTSIGTLNGYFTLTTQSTATNSGAMQLLGGLGVAKNIYVGGAVVATGDGTFNSISVGTLNTTVSGHTTSIGTLNGYFSLTTQSTSTNSGAMQLLGGLGVAKNIYVGGVINGASITQPITDNSTAIATDAFVKNVISSFNSLENIPTGFENQTDSQITYDSVLRSLSISPTSSSFNVWISGTIYTYSTTLSLTHADAVGNYYYYFNASGLNVSTTAPSYYTTAYCAVAMYFGDKYGFICNERHALVMDPATHYMLHNQTGTYLVSGCTIGNYQLAPSTPTNANNQFSLTSGVISDETLLTNISAISSGTYNVVEFLSTNANWTINQRTVPFNYTGSGNIEYNRYSNSTWASNPIPNGYYVNYYIIAVNSSNTSTQVFMKPGQLFYSSLSLALAETYNMLTPSLCEPVEYVVLYQITFGASNTYSNLGNCRIESVNVVNGSRVSVSASNSSTNTINSYFTAATPSTSINSGAMIVSGGMGVGGDVYVGGLLSVASNCYFTLTDIATATNSGSVQIAGGLGVAKNAYFGGMFYCLGDGIFNGISVGSIAVNYANISSYFTSTTQSTATNSGAMQLLGGLGVAKNIYVGGAVVATGDGTFNSISVGTLNTSVNTLNSYFTLTTQSTSTNSGAMQLLGGLGVAKNIYVGGTANITNSTSPQMTLGYDASNKITFGVDSGGDLSVNCSGNDWYWNNTNIVHIPSGMGATSETTGALIVAGGIGVGQNVMVGSGFTASNSSTNADVYMSLIASSVNDGGTHVKSSLLAPGVGGTIIEFGATDSVATTKIGRINHQGSGQFSIMHFDDGVNRVTSLNSTSTNIKIQLTTPATDTLTGALVVSGGASIGTSLYVGGKTSIISTTSPQLTLGYDAPDNVIFTVSSVGDLTVDCSGNDWYWANTDIVHIQSTTTPTDTLTGSLTVSGGIGVGKDVYVGGVVQIKNATPATNTLTGALVVSGGASIGTALYVGGKTSIISTTSPQLTLGYDATDNVIFTVSSVGDLTVDCSGNDWYWANTDIVHIQSTANSTSTSNGALIVSGGVGMGGDLNVRSVYVNNSIYYPQLPDTQWYLINSPTTTQNTNIIAMSPSENMAQLINTSGTFTTTVNKYDVSNTPQWEVYTYSLGAEFVLVHDYIDGHSTYENTVPEGQYLWQGFTPSDSLYLNEIDLTVRGSGSACQCTITLYTGLGIAGTILNQWSLTIPTTYFTLSGSSGKYNKIFLTPAQMQLLMTPQQYTIQLTLNSGSLICHRTNGWGPSQLNVNGTSQGSADIGIYALGATLTGYSIFCKGVAGTIIQNVNSQSAITLTAYGSNTYPNGSYNGGIVYDSATVASYNINDITNITNTTDSTSTTSGSLIISGGLCVAKNVYIANTVHSTQYWANNIGTPSAQSNLMYQAYDTVNAYIQNNIQNLSTGTAASSDYIATCNTGTDSTGYIDMGINSSGFTGSIGGICDGYLYVQGGSSGGGGNLYIGTTTTNMKTYFINNSLNIMSLTSDGLNITSTTASTSATTGSLIVNGGVGIGGSMYLPTSGGTASALNYYEESSPSVTTAGGLVTTFTINIVKIGKSVTITFPALSSTATASSGIYFSNLPTRFGSVISNLYLPCIAYKNGVYQMGCVNISGQTVTWYADATGATFTSGQTCGWRAASINYQSS